MKVLAAMDEAAKSLERALDEARSSKLEGEPFFAQLAEAYGRLHFAAALMRAYGKVDPKDYEGIKAHLFKK